MVLIVIKLNSEQEWGFKKQSPRNLYQLYKSNFETKIYLFSAKNLKEFNEITIIEISPMDNLNSGFKLI
jgi:hypothetical protein